MRADPDVVVAPMVAAFHFGDHGSSRRSPCGLECCHRGFSAGIAEADLVNGGYPRNDGLSKPDLQLMWSRHTHAMLGLETYGGVHVWMPVAVDHGRVIVQKIGVAVAIDVHKSAASGR